MSVINNLQNLINNLSLLYTNDNLGLNVIENNYLNNLYVDKLGDTINGTLTVSNINSDNNLNIGNSSNNINIGNQNSNNNIINIGSLNDNINFNNNLNINNNNIKNVSLGNNNNDGVSLSKLNIIMNNKIPSRLSDFTDLNEIDIDMNNYKLIDVANGINEKDAVNLYQVNNIMPKKLSDFTELNESDINLNNNKIKNISDGINNNDAVNYNQATNLILDNMPKKLSDLTDPNDNNISLNSFRLTNMSNGVDIKDGVNLIQVNNLINDMKPTKLSQLTENNLSDISLNNYKITDVANGVDNNDSVNLSQVNTILSNEYNSVSFNNINTFGSDINNVLLGDGTFGKITNNQIDNLSISASKLTGYPNDSTKFLSGNGTFKYVYGNSSKVIGKFELFSDETIPTTNDYIRQGSVNILSNDYPLLSNIFYKPYQLYYNKLKKLYSCFKLNYVNNYFFIINQISFNYKNEIIYSSDGLNWNIVKLPYSGWTYSSIAYNSGWYIISSLNSYTIFRSSDLINWEAITMNYTGGATYYPMVYGNNYFVTVDYSSGYSQYSSNYGYSWNTNAYLPNTVSMVYSSNLNLFVGVSTNNTYYVSTSGTSWSTYYFSTSASVYAWKIKYINNIFIVVNLSTKSLITSSNGYGWSEVFTPECFYDISYGNGIYVALNSSGNTIYVSTNLSNWTLYTLYNNGNSIEFGNNLFLITAYNTLYYSIFSNIPCEYLNLGNVRTLSNPTVCKNITYGTKFLIYNLNNYDSYLSNNGYDWTSSSLPYLSAIDGVYGNSLYVVILYNYSKILKSSDGINWTSINIPFTSSISIIYSNDKFVVLNDNSSTYITSTDGTTWTQRTLPISLSWLNIVYGNNIYIATAKNTTSYLTSSDGISWVQRNFSFYNYGCRIRFLNNIFIVVCYEMSTVYTSSDGINWNTINLPCSAKWIDVAYGLGIYIILSNTCDINTNSNIIAVSKDAINWYYGSLNLSIFYWNCIIFANNIFLLGSNNMTKYLTISNLNIKKFNLPPLTEPSGFQYWIIAK